VRYLILLFIFSGNVYNAIAQDSIATKGLNYDYAIIYAGLLRNDKVYLKIFYDNGKIEDMMKIKGLHFKPYFDDSTYLNSITIVFKYLNEQGFELISSHMSSQMDSYLNTNKYTHYPFEFMQYIFGRKKK
jgi:hypothetical protein